MSTNQKGSGSFIKITGAATKGALITVGSLVGVVANTLAANEEGVAYIEGEFEVAKLGTDVVAAGAPLYHDVGNSRLTLTASTHKFAGNAMAAAGNGVTVVTVKLAGRSTI